MGQANWNLIHMQTVRICIQIGVHFNKSVETIDAKHFHFILNAIKSLLWHINSNRAHTKNQQQQQNYALHNANSKTDRC